MPERTCYECQNNILCFVRKNIEKALDTATGNILNIDAPGLGSFTDVYGALARACFLFKPHKEEKGD